MAFSGEIIKFSRLCNLNNFGKLSRSGSLKNLPFITSVRTAKHYNPKFKWLRKKKVIDVTLPFTEKFKEEQRYLIKNLGLYPRYWKNRTLTLTSATEIFDPYIPPDGDGKVSKFSSKGIIEKVTSSSKATITEKTALRKIRNYNHNFEKNVFLQEAHDIYVKAHTVLMKQDPEELSKYATDKAVSEMTDGLKLKTLHWKFIESLEPPKLVQSRVQEIFTSKNVFAQLTVRFHTKQILAIYDRFGRLMYGSEILAKDVLEYVVFENHISNEYGVWRVHAKIIPEWKESTFSPRTYRIEEEVEDDEEDEDEDEGFSNEHYNAFRAESEHKAVSEIVQAESKASN